ncbi:uncharacterized protein MYCFIDRAFT_198616 [Pseudocercospora fijiensis CIRAD86]|uniref:Uncharacterized protein n=1 Tax=Pseudocercospora fijiensis (strain CIRAD86) TaxID=383855 RepID=M3ATA5_PSEFD|nr:uncharacterized protein MYCFIDRAFT_198616 [Pseudocercospora fijiensis CIRAD86]EME80368.1 hypothetical protein MYCFIDRAFT_198616 [Pseudocercospora fijiensis CIRAD86]
MSPFRDCASRELFAIPSPSKARRLKRWAHDALSVPWGNTNCPPSALVLHTYLSGPNANFHGICCYAVLRLEIQWQRGFEQGIAFLGANGCQVAYTLCGSFKNRIVASAARVVDYNLIQA